MANRTRSNNNRRGWSWRAQNGDQGRGSLEADQDCQGASEAGLAQNRRQGRWQNDNNLGLAPNTSDCRRSGVEVSRHETPTRNADSRNPKLPQQFGGSVGIVGISRRQILRREKSERLCIVSRARVRARET